MRKLIGILSLALSAGCGTVGAPQPPSLHLPEPVRDLRASRKGDKVTLTWTQPTETTDHEAVGRWVGTTNICRTIVPNSNMPAMSSCSERVGQTAPQPAAKTALAAGQTDELSLELENSQPTAFAGYAVEVTNRRGRSAGLSNAVSVPLAPTRQPPGNLTAEVRADGVYFTATPVAGPVNDALRFSYRLYRRTEPAAAGENPALVAEQPTDDKFAAVDRNFEWEKKYSYWITPATSVLAASGQPQAVVEGEDSAPVEVFTHDVFPPAEPTGVQAVFSGMMQQKFIDVTWVPNTENDLAGYNVYRHEQNEAAARINGELVKTPAFRDSNVAAGHTYFYSVTAVDLRGNESARSQETSETVPAQ